MSRGSTGAGSAGNSFGAIVGLITYVVGGIWNLILLLCLLISVWWVWDWFTEYDIPKSQVQVSSSVYDMGDVDDLAFTARVTGKIKNDSKYNLQTVDFVVTVYDCPTTGTPLDLCRKLKSKEGQFTPYADPDTYSEVQSLVFFNNVPIVSGVRSFDVKWSNPVGDSDLEVSSN